MFYSELIFKQFIPFFSTIIIAVLIYLLRRTNKFSIIRKAEKKLTETKIVVEVIFISNKKKKKIFILFKIGKKLL